MFPEIISFFDRQRQKDKISHEVHQTPFFPRKFEEKEDGGSPNEEEFSRKDNDGAFNISEFVSILPTLYSSN